MAYHKHIAALGFFTEELFPLKSSFWYRPGQQDAKHCHRPGPPRNHSPAGHRGVGRAPLLPGTGFVTKVAHLSVEEV